MPIPKSDPEFWMYKSYLQGDYNYWTHRYWDVPADRHGEWRRFQDLGYATGTITISCGCQEKGEKMNKLFTVFVVDTDEEEVAWEESVVSSCEERAKMKVLGNAIEHKMVEFNRLEEYDCLVFYNGAVRKPQKQVESE